MHINSDASTQEIAEKLQTAGLEFGNIVAALAMTRDNGTDAAHLYLSSMVGQLMGLIGTIREKGGDADKPKNLKKQILFATLVLYHSVNLTDLESSAGGDLTTGFETFMSAIEDYERFTGEKVDGVANKHMLAAMRTFAQEGEKPLASFLANRSNNNKLN